MNSNGWSDWEKHVLYELGRLSTNQDEILRLNQQIKIEIITLKVKAAIWGAITGGTITAIIALVSAVLARA